MSKKLTFATLAAILVLATVVGIATYKPVSAHHEVAAVVEVTHAAWSGRDYDIPVEPDTGETWTITGTWKYWGFPDVVETGSVDVDWNGTSWALSNQTTTTGIVGYTVCADGECGLVMDPHGYGYKLVVTIDKNANQAGYYIDNVEFLVSSIDDGCTLTGTPCDTDEAVSVVSPYYFSTTDSGTFETTVDCNATGPSVTIQYD